MTDAALPRGGRGGGGGGGGAQLLLGHHAEHAYLLVKIGASISGGAGRRGGGLVQQLAGRSRPEPLLVGRDNLGLQMLCPSRGWGSLQWPQ